MELIRKLYLDNETKEIVAKKYYIGKLEITEDDYFDILDSDEKEDTDDDDEEYGNYCNQDCATCEMNDMPEEETIEEIIEEYTIQILNSNGCPGCIEESLYSFYDRIADKIINELD